MIPFIGGTIKTGLIVDNWPEILRLATSTKAGTTTASAILKSLSAYPRQNELAIALCELGRLGRTLLPWNGCEAWNCAKEPAQVWPEERQETLSHVGSSSTNSVKYATAAMSIRSTKHRASTFWLPPSSCGTPDIWKPQSLVTAHPIYKSLKLHNSFNANRSDKIPHSP